MEYCLHLVKPLMNSIGSKMGKIYVIFLHVWFQIFDKNGIQLTMTVTFDMHQ